MLCSNIAYSAKLELDLELSLDITKIVDKFHTLISF